MSLCNFNDFFIMKKLATLLLFAVIFNVLPLHSQFATTPKLWLKPYQSGDSATFVVADSTIANPSFSFGYINFNIGLTPKSDTPFFRYMGRDMSHNGKVTVVSAYFTNSNDSIGVWNIARNGADNLWLNSTEVSYRGFGIPYRDVTEQGPIVNISRLNYFEAKSGLEADDTLSVGGDGRYAFDGMFGEFIYFDRDMSYLEEQQWATYLAIKYGATLRSNYIGLRGDTIWDIEKQSNYSKGIAGIWRNDTFGLLQTKSGIYSDNVIIEIGGTFTDNDYILWGHNGEGLLPNISLNIDTIDYLLLDREWKVLSSESCRGKATSLAYRYPSGIAPLGMALVVDRYGLNDEFNSYGSTLYSPTRVVGDMVFFDNVVWDTDGNGSDYFRLAVIADSIDSPTMAMVIDENSSVEAANKQFSNNSFSRQKDIFDNGLNNNNKTGMAVLLTPNPTDGVFRLVIRQKQPSALSISIVDSTGRLVKKYNKPNAGEVTELEDTIDTTGVFLIHIDSDNERQTLKLVVK